MEEETTLVSVLGKLSAVVRENVVVSAVDVVVSALDVVVSAVDVVISAVDVVISAVDVVVSAVDVVVSVVEVVVSVVEVVVSAVVVSVVASAVAVGNEDGLSVKVVVSSITSCSVAVSNGTELELDETNVTVEGILPTEYTAPRERKNLLSTSFCFLLSSSVDSSSFDFRVVNSGSEKSGPRPDEEFTDSKSVKNL